MTDPSPLPHLPAASLKDPATRAISAGRSASGRALAPAIWASTTWESTSLDDAHARAISARGPEFYSRYGNPSVRDFEAAIADLEGAESALAFGSGMGAVASVVLALCSTGDHIVAQRQLYAGTLSFLQGPCARLGIEVTFVDGFAPGAFEAAIRPGRTMLAIAETPSNPRLDIVNLATFGALHGPITMVDSTFATPLGQQPLAYGVDLVMHSATKGIAGHNDATLGVIAGEAELINEIWSYGVLHGAAASPYDAVNALRGIRTLAVRVAQQSASALELATALSTHPAVNAVHYPGLSTHQHHDLASHQMHHFGSVLSIEVEGGRDRVRSVCEQLRLCRLATSLGGPETLVCHPATTTHAGLNPEEQVANGVTESMLRISVGLESPSDLLADLSHALTHAAAPG
jgi:cystathionine beta-lyase/cystathionine gamma-synthase